MRFAGSVTALLAALLACAALPARAEMGPCQPDKFEGFTCGSGVGAARVIDNTLSPDKRLAFAWRNPKGEPIDEPAEGDALEDALDFLLVRLADGAILAKSTTGYWDNGESHANRLMEDASWSPDGRLVARAYQSRFETERFELYALGAKDELIGTLNLQQIIDPAVRAQLRAPDAKSWSFAVAPGTSKVSLSNAGLLRLKVLMWVPKFGPEEYYDVALRITRDKNGVRARLASIKKGKEPD